MDVNFIDSNEQIVRNLYGVVLGTTEHIETESREMLNFLRVFKHYIDEDAYDKIYSYITKNIRALENAKPALKYYADTLSAMADKLRRLKNSLSDNGGQVLNSSHNAVYPEMSEEASGNKIMSTEDVNKFYISGLESIELQIDAYREALIDRGVTDEEWLRNTMIHHSELMKKQLTNDLETSQGRAAHEDIYQYPADMKQFYDEIYEEYLKYTTDKE